MLGTAILRITRALLGNVMGVMLGAPKIAEVLIAGGIGATGLKESLSILANLMRLGVYVPKGIKRKKQDGLGDLKDKA